jgi:hypothetical protein
MANLGQVNMDALFVMMKGEPGTRKSTQALSFPGRQFWISTDRKMESLVLPAKRWGIKLTDIDYEDYTNWDAPKAKLKQFQLNCPYKTIIVDSITSIGDNMTSQVRASKAGKEGGGKVIGGIQVSGLEEYNAEAAAFQELIAMLKDIHSFHKVNIILIAHVVGQRKSDDANKLTHHSRVIITGGDKISGKLASYMTEVYHFNVKPGFAETDEGEYGLFTSHTGNDYARTSLPLERNIAFNDKPLYDRWIAPAIAKLNAEKPIERIPPPPPKPTTPTQPTPFVKP